MSFGDLTLQLGRFATEYTAALESLRSDRVVSRIWNRDATVWKTDESNTKIITNALGWLEVASTLRNAVPDLLSFTEEVRGSFDDVVVLGMGGSSLCSEVMLRTFGPRAGFPRLRVLDSTVPAAVLALERSLNLQRTLFMVASKSGSTTEPVMFHRYFYDRVRAVVGDRVGENFIAVTDPETQLFRDATHDRFRRIFVNFADIGGRYSALSYFGMVPAALTGVDVETLLDRAVAAQQSCRSEDLDANPGARLGAALGALAHEDADKLTVLAGDPVGSIGLWIEQLVAESTGKEGIGILPVALEPIVAPEAYGTDRVFVALETPGDPSIASVASSLHAASFPVIERRLDDALDLGAEMYIWEFATAIAGAVLAINPFDQPNVQESKDNTKSLLAGYVESGSLPSREPIAEGDDLRIYGPAGQEKAVSPEAAIRRLLESVTPGDYVALTHYIKETASSEATLQRIRRTLVERLHVATTSGYGPRFLHSTGQFHKGGPDSGVFMQITADDAEDVAIPGEPFGFSVLARAQALGDFASLESRGRRALRVHLGSNVEAGLAKLAEIIERVI